MDWSKFGNTRKLADTQIIEIRYLYYYLNHSRSELAKQFDISSALVQRIVEYQNGYSDIKDSIPQNVKDNRRKNK